MIFCLPLQLNSCETLNKSHKVSVMLFCICYVKVLGNNEGKTILSKSTCSINVRLTVWLLILLFDLESEGWTGLQSWRTVCTEVPRSSASSRRGSSKREDQSRIPWEECDGKDPEPGGLGLNPDSVIDKLCDLEHVIQSPCASVFSSLRWG